MLMETMKTNESKMETGGGEKLALRTVKMTGRVDGLLLRASIRQEYINETGKNLEIVYTFPLVWGASLLRFDAQIGDKPLSAVVLEKKEAEEKYEKAVAEGDTPMLLQSSGPGLYTVNLGNIKDGESVQVEIHYAQLLNFEQGRIRLRVPTALAPRYGDAHVQGGLAAHETDKVDLAAHYPLSISLDILGETAQAEVTCPTHKVRMERTEEGLSVRLENGAMLDRDFVLLLDGLAGKSFALSAPDREEHLLLAGFCPKMSVKSDPVLLKILVDCSGSMSGDSIKQAQQALQQVLRELKGEDYVSYSRFGSDVQHFNKELRPCDADILQNLSQVIASTEADMGGTELARALRSACKDIALPKGNESKPCILLITDDLVWGRIERAAFKGHRIFAVVVSSAPSPEISATAERSGGACEFVTPNENMAAAIVRMFHRMRTSPAQTPRLDWGAKPLWQTALPEAIFDGDVVYVFAAFKEMPGAQPALSWEAQGQTEHACTEKIAAVNLDDLPRLAAARRIAVLEEAEKLAARQSKEKKALGDEALALALKYQLPCRYTSFFLVYDRANADKLQDMPVLQQTPQMLAAGYGGFGSVRSRCLRRSPIHSQPLRSCYEEYSCQESPELQKLVMRTSRSFRKKPDRVLRLAPLAFLQKFDELVLSGADYAAALQAMREKHAGEDLRQHLALLASQNGLVEDDAWAVLLDWLQSTLTADFTPARQSRRLLGARLSAMNTKAEHVMRVALENAFQSLNAHCWGKRN